MATEAPRAPGRPRDARHDESILRAGLAILREEGYRGLSIERVASRAGVGRPTIYRRWPSKPALVVAALVHSSQIAVRVVDTGTLRGDLVAIQRRQVELMNAPENRRVTAGLVADLAADPELSQTYVNDYLVPRRAAILHVLRVERGELDPEMDFAFAYDLLVGPLFMRAVVWGQELAPEAAEATADVIVATFGVEKSRKAS